MTKPWTSASLQKLADELAENLGTHVRQEAVRALEWSAAREGERDDNPFAEADRIRVWWIPQVPGEPFNVEVRSIKEGRKLLHVLADYDRFQFEHQVKPDYCNAGGLEQYEDGEWCEIDGEEVE